MRRFDVLATLLLVFTPLAASAALPSPGLPPLGHAEASPELVALGRALFFARELSVDQTVACADCHRPELAFTDGRARARGVGGAEHRRSAMSLTYSAWAPALGWADPRRRRLEDQALEPLLAPGEMGLLGREEEALVRLAAPSWRRRFVGAFGDELPTVERVTVALAAFQRTLGRFSSDFDRWIRGEADLTAEAREGMRLFFSERVGCGRCHGGTLFSGPVRHGGDRDVVPLFRRTGVLGSDTGVAEITGREFDRFSFRVPTLRNIALTAPYFHDGRLETLPQVLDFYAAGPRRIDPKADPTLVGFELSAPERKALLSFLESLTDN